MNETLEHHGILGMKWGVRRYQNKDGTWTKEGKEHRAEESKETKELDEESRAANEKVQELSGELMTSRDRTKARAQQAAITGLNALKTTGLRDVDDPDDVSEQMWFLYEDQTIGLPQIADLANKGYSEEKINNIVSDGVDAFKKSSYWPYADSPFDSSGLWCLYEGSSGDGSFPSEYIKACVDYVKTKKDDAKHSDTTSTEDSLMHYGILGMKWGIRRYQNKDGSLTAAGRKRYGDDIPDGNKSSSGDASNSTPRTPAKSASEMTDQELNQALNRLRMEQQYNELTGAKSSNQYQNQQNFSTPPSNTGNLSNAELQAYITRLDMEKRYAQLTAPPPKEVSAGRKFMNDVVGPAINQVAKAFIVASLSKALGLKGDGDNGGNNNNNGGKKNNNDDSQYKSIKKELNDLKSMMGSQRKQDNGGNQKKESKREETPEAANLLPEPGKTSYKEHRNSIIDAARAAADAAREKKRQRDSLSSRLSDYRSDREKARQREQDRAERERQREQDRAERERQREDDRRKAAWNPYSSDYYRSMWTYGM